MHIQIWLNKDNIKYCLKISDEIINKIKSRGKQNFDILKKALEFTLSVFIMIDQEVALVYLKKWFKKNDILVDKIIKKNLNKNRILKLNNDKINIFRIKIEEKIKFKNY